MEILITTILILSLIFIFKKSKTRSPIKDQKLSLKELVKKTFPKYKVIEKNQTIMICEFNHRNEPDELVFIRINPSKQKTIRNSGRMLIVDYPKTPSAKQMKFDFGRHLN